MKWLDYLENFLNEDVTTIKNILDSESDKLTEAVNKAFLKPGHPYVSKKEALLVLENDLVEDSWISANKKRISKKIKSLTEGEIRIIINNDISKGGSSAPVVMGGEPVGAASVEFESTKPKRRGRPPKARPEEPIVEKSDGFTFAIMTYDSDEPVAHVNAGTSKDAMTKAKVIVGGDVDFWLEKVEGVQECATNECENKKQQLEEEDASDLSWEDIAGKIKDDDEEESSEEKEEETEEEEEEEEEKKEKKEKKDEDEDEEEESDGTTEKEYEEDDGLETTEKDLKKTEEDKE